MISNNVYWTHVRSPSKTLKASDIEGMKLRIAFAYIRQKMERVRMLQITNIFTLVKSKTRPLPCAIFQKLVVIKRPLQMLLQKNILGHLIFSNPMSGMNLHSFEPPK